jgi:hypothetical protein
MAHVGVTDRAGNVTSGAFGSMSYGPFGSAPCAYDGQYVWTAGPEGTAGKFWFQGLATSPPGPGPGTTNGTVPGSPSNPAMPFALVFEPATATLWFTDFFNGLVVMVDPIALTGAAAVPLVVGPSSYAATGLVAVGGLLYAAGVHNAGA